MAAERSRDILDSVGRELRDNPPGILAKTRRRKGTAAADKQRVAILLNKARKRGAKVPSRKDA